MRISEPVLIVERVKPGSPAERAGILPGCRLLAYNGQSLVSPSMLKALEDNTFGLEHITLRVEWEGQRREAPVPPGSLGVETRPDLSAPDLAAYMRGRDAFEEKQYAEAVRIWREAAQDAEAGAPAVWLLIKAGKAWEEAEDWQSALPCYQAAHELLADGHDDALHVTALAAKGGCLWHGGDLEAAALWYVQAQQIAERRAWPAWNANAFHIQGMIAFEKGDLKRARQQYDRASALRAQFAPISQDMVESFNGLGLVAWKEADLANAQNCFARALDMQESLTPGSAEVAAILNNLGLIACLRGNLERAENYHLSALHIRERLLTETPSIETRFNVAMSLANLGAVAWARGNQEIALDYYNRATAIGESLASDRPEVTSLLAECHTNLGIIACKRGELEDAETRFQAAMNILARLAPESVDVAACLNGLGNVEWKRGDLERAEFRLERADLHDTRAQDHCDRAAVIFESLAPLSLDYAEALMERGQAALRRERWAQAVVPLQKAIDILERQRAHIVAPEARALLVAQHTAKYASLIRAYAALGNPEDAFFTLERARARSFVEMLAERDVELAVDASPEMTDLLNQMQEADIQLAHVYDHLRQLSTTSAHDPQVRDWQRKRNEAEHQKQELTARLRAMSPDFAALQYPQPLSLKAAQALLTKGMLLLSYCVDEEQTFLFAVTPAKVTIHVLPLGRAALQEKTRAFRLALNPHRVGNEDGAQAIRLGRELYTALIAPARALLKDAKRLLLCQDGPLHTLPFGALVTNPSGSPLYLGAQKPLHSALSMTLYAQSRQQKPIPNEQHRRRIFALGDPQYASAAPGSAPAYERLPHSRQEVEFLARLFGRDAIVRLGAQATKTAVLTECGEADIVHLACHGWFDARTPLSSGLALSSSHAAEEQTVSAASEESREVGRSRSDGVGEQTPPGDNGRLEAWEILQSLRLRADLVVLPACWSAVGQEVRGEGLIGLARAFQYAGTQSLVASLWAVNDASTSLFMQAFYQALKAGDNKDDALQQGVLALRAHSDYGHPYYWSAFVLIGDRRNVAGPDEVWVRKAQQGNSRAYDHFVLQYRTPIERLCTRILFNNRTEAENIAQEAFVNAWTNIHTYQWEAPFQVWLTKIAHNAALNIRRTVTGQNNLRGRRFEDDEAGEADANETRQPGPGVEETVTDAVFLEQVAEQWPEACRRHAQAAQPPWDTLDYLIYALRYENFGQDNMPISELAHQLKRPAGTIRDRVNQRILPVLRAAARELGLKN